MPKFFIKRVYIGDFKGVLFDKDGTLTNSETHLLEIASLRIEESIKELKKEFKEEDIKRFSNLIQSAYGLSSEGIDPHGSIAIASQHDNLVSTATVFSLMGMNWPKACNLATNIFSKVDKVNLNKKTNKNKRPLLSGLLNFLNNLENSQVKCALISNDTKKGIENFLNYNNLENKFSRYWSCEDYPSKPNPNAIKELCRIIKLDPSECALIGDSDLDMQMAKKAGIGLAIGYVSGWKTRPQLSHQNKIIFNWDDISCL